MTAPRRTHRTWLLIGIAVSLSAFGCAHTDSGRTAAEDLLNQRRQRQQQGEEAYRQGARCLRQGDLALAEERLRQAVELDPYHGPARNDLGVVYHRQGDLYQAALEFSSARNLLPDSYRPDYNLGVVLEESGRLREAAETYERALERAPDQLDVIEALARTYVRSGRERKRALELMKKALRTEQRPEWRDWLKKELQRRAAALPDTLGPGKK